MLILTRRLGQALYIRNSVRLSLRDKLRFHAVVAVLAPADSRVLWLGQLLQPAVLPAGGAMYLLPLLSGQHFQVDEADVRVWFDTSTGSRRYRDRAVRFGVSAPLTWPVHREEVLLRIREEQELQLPLSAQSDDMSRSPPHSMPEEAAA